jgi:hypothetical protein
MYHLLHFDAVEWRKTFPTFWRNTTGYITHLSTVLIIYTLEMEELFLQNFGNHFCNQASSKYRKKSKIVYGLKWKPEIVQ